MVHGNIAHQVSYSKSLVGNKHMQLPKGSFLILSLSLDRGKTIRYINAPNRKTLFTSLPAVTAN
jgi:hypothetical protein